MRLDSFYKDFSELLSVKNRVKLVLTVGQFKRFVFLSILIENKIQIHSPCSRTNYHLVTHKCLISSEPECDYRGNKIMIKNRFAHYASEKIERAKINIEHSHPLKLINSLFDFIGMFALPT